MVRNVLFAVVDHFLLRFITAVGSGKTRLAPASRLLLVWSPIVTAAPLAVLLGAFYYFRRCSK